MIFRRPWVLFLLIVAVLVFSAASFLRFAMAFSLWDFLSSLPAAVSPVYHAVAGFIWGVFGAVTAVWLWRGHHRGKGAARILAVTFALYYWIDQVFVGASEIRQTNWQFSGILTALMLVLVFGSLALPAVSNFFGEENEQEK